MGQSIEREKYLKTAGTAGIQSCFFCGVELS